MSTPVPPVTPVEPQLAQVDATVLIERRKFPRELPKPEVRELDSDSAWQAFQESIAPEES